MKSVRTHELESLFFELRAKGLKLPTLVVKSGILNREAREKLPSLLVDRVAFSVNLRANWRECGLHLWTFMASSRMRVSARSSA